MPASTSDPNKLPEQRARANIDAALVEAGWVVQSRGEMNVAAGLGVAIREFKTDAGFADYLLYVDKKPAGVIEAKREGVALTGVEAQTKDYAAGVPKELPVPIRPLPFLYESTGVETRFTNLLDPTPRSRTVFSFHQPATLAKWLDDAIAIAKGRPGAPVAATFLGRMRQAPPLHAVGMWPAQIAAVESLERSIKQGRPRALIQMATGSGKTFTAIAALYRMIKFGGARRVLFLVDRGNLGRQAYKEIQAYTTPDDGRKFTELYNVTCLASNKIDPVNRVVITTIQRLYSILKGDDELDPELEEGSAFMGSGAALLREPPPVVYSKIIPPEFFDVVVVDECHRSIYSLWRQVLEYFDASLIGLTATPAKNTFAFFEKLKDAHELGSDEPVVEHRLAELADARLVHREQVVVEQDVLDAVVGHVAHHADHVLDRVPASAPPRRRATAVPPRPSSPSPRTATRHAQREGPTPRPRRSSRADLSWRGVAPSASTIAKSAVAVEPTGSRPRRARWREPDHSGRPRCSRSGRRGWPRAWADRRDRRRWRGAHRCSRRWR